MRSYNVFEGDFQLLIYRSRSGQGDSLEKPKAILGCYVVPDRFARERQCFVRFHERAPADRDFRFAKQLLGQDQEKQVRAAVAHQLVELGAIVEAILQRTQLAHKTRVPAVTDRAEVLGIELGE